MTKNSDEQIADLLESIRSRLSSINMKPQQTGASAIRESRSDGIHSRLATTPLVHQKRLERFEELLIDPIDELKQLKETDGIEDYYVKFEQLSTSLNLSEAVLVSVFLAGLCVDTRINVQMFNPLTIRNCLLVGKLYERAHPPKRTVTQPVHIEQVKNTEESLVPRLTVPIQTPRSILASVEIDCGKYIMLSSIPSAPSQLELEKYHSNGGDMLELTSTLHGKQAVSILEQDAILSNAPLQRVSATKSQNTKVNQQKELTHNIEASMGIDSTKEHESPGLRYSIFGAERVWEPGGLPAKGAQWYWPEKHYNHDDMLQLTLKLHMIEVHVLSCLQELGVRSHMDNVLNLLVRMGCHNIKLEAAVDIRLLAQHISRRMTIHNVLEITKPHEMCSFLSLKTNSEMSIMLPREIQDRLVKATCALAIITIQSDISFDDWVAQEVRRSCVEIVYEVAEMFKKLCKSGKFKFQSQYEMLAKESWEEAGTPRDVTQTCLFPSRDAPLFIPQEFVTARFKGKFEKRILTADKLKFCSDMVKDMVNKFSSRDSLHKVLSSLQRFKCSYNFSLRIYCKGEPTRKTFTVIILQELATHATELKSANARSDEDLVHNDEPCNTDGKQETELLFQFMKDSRAEALAAKNVTGILHFGGSIFYLAFLNVKEPGSQTVADIKADIIKSLQSSFMLVNLVVKVSSKEGDLMQGIGRNHLTANAARSSDTSTLVKILYLIVLGVSKLPLRFGVCARI